MGNQLRELAAVGQSVWLDNIRRSMFASGELKGLIDQGLRGQTSNPTIFEKAIGSGTDYDAQLKTLVGGEHDAQKLFEALAIQDIRSACDTFAEVFRSTNGLDGYVSREVSPTLAHDTQATTDAALRLWKAVDRPNVMIKIPGTPECIASIRSSIASGVNINVTLLFSVDQYAAAAGAYIAGLEDRVQAGLPGDKIRDLKLSGVAITREVRIPVVAYTGDTAPAGLVTDALGVAAGASATILVVEAGKTKSSQAANTIEALREVGANVIGVVLNKTSRRVGAGYSYRYGYSTYADGKTSRSDAAAAGDLLSPDPSARPPAGRSSESGPGRGALTAPLR